MNPFNQAQQKPVTTGPEQPASIKFNQPPVSGEKAKENSEAFMGWWLEEGFMQVLTKIAEYNPALKNADTFKKNLGELIISHVK